MATKITVDEVTQDVTVTVSNERGPSGLGSVTSATTSDGTANLSLASATVSGTLTADHIHGNIAGSVYLHIRAGEALSKGDPVYVSGSHGTGSAMVPIVMRADASDLEKMPAIAIMDAAVANNGSGHAVISGAIADLNTAAYSVNSTLYVASGGGMTATKPANAQPVARVERSNANNGGIVVKVNGLYSDVSVASSQVTDATAQSTPNTIAKRDTRGSAAFGIGETYNANYEVYIGGDYPISGLENGNLWSIDQTGITTDRSYTLPDASGTIVLDTTLTAASIAAAMESGTEQEKENVRDAIEVYGYADAAIVGKLSYARKAMFDFSEQGINHFVSLRMGDSMAEGSRSLGMVQTMLANKLGLAGLALDALARSSSGLSVSVSYVDSGNPPNANFAYSIPGTWARIPAGAWINHGTSLAGVIQPFICRELTVYYVERPGGGTFKLQWSLNGSTGWTDIGATVNTDAGSGNPTVVKVHKVDMGFNRSVVMRVLGVSGDTDYIGGKMLRLSNGAVLAGMGRGGLHSASWLNVTPQAMVGPILKDLGVDWLTIYNTDYEDSDPYVEGLQRAWIEGLVDYFSNAGEYPSVTVMGMVEGRVYNSFEEVVNETRRTCNDNNWHFFETNANLGGLTNITNLGWNAVDSIHLDPPADKATATALLSQTGLLDPVSTQMLQKFKSVTGAMTVVLADDTQTLDGLGGLTLAVRARQGNPKSIVFGSSDVADASTDWNFHGPSTAADRSFKIGYGVNGNPIRFDTFGRIIRGYGVAPAHWNTSSSANGYSYTSAENTNTKGGFSAELDNVDTTSASPRAYRVIRGGVETAYTRYDGVPKFTLTSYVDDAAAAADTTLLSGCAYLLTGSTIMRIKP